MGRHKSEFGRCRLCGEKKTLSFEHVPPRSSFNKNTIYNVSSVMDVLESDNPFHPKNIGKTKQGGTGNNSLCLDCNNFLGRTYVNSYNGWVNVGNKILRSYKETPISFIISNFEPLKVIKQIYSMFISMDDENCFDRHKDLCEFVKDPNSSDLDEKYQILLYLINEGDTIYIPPMCVGNFKTGLSVFGSEISFPPFGYVFTIDNNSPIDNLFNITYFKTFKLVEKVDIKIQNLHKLQKNLPILLDYRTKEQINEGRTSGDLDKNIQNP